VKDPPKSETICGFSTAETARRNGNALPTGSNARLLSKITSSFVHVHSKLGLIFIGKTTKAVGLKR
jgi:hypothetical protein